MVATLPEVDAQIEALLGDVQRDLDISRRTRIFCNRNLRMTSIELIGFDMDYTLALYQQERLEQLSIELTLNKMIANHGYPREILELPYDPRWAIRGLVVDKQLGNVFKMDRHGHVGRVYHGKRLLDRDERRELYRHTRIQLSQERYAWIDTLFGLPEAVMYITLMDWFAKRPSRPEHWQLFDDIRKSIDEAHADDTLKSVIKADLKSFIVKDPRLGECLHKLRSAGRKLFVLTNSLWDYTDAVMSYLLDGERRAYPSWRNYFDYVIVGGRKPAFFAEANPFLLVDTANNTVDAVAARQLLPHRVYQGGNIVAFEEMTGVRGEHVLYIGDHIYGDVMRLKKSHIWRTAMVIQELEREIMTGDRLDQQIRDLDLLDRRRRNLESEVDYQATILKRLQRAKENGETDPARLDEAIRSAKRSLESLRDRLRLMEEEVDAIEDTIDRAYNPYWGAVFREGNENSRFGEQVSDYSDLYTSRASNFLSYSPMRYFRAPRRPAPHEI
ncbi:MAG TPA: HAD-IG family 5'-nucleotidase [Kofleriaceae bacterium]|nr:HAD-IG family 5'-nucleotidase [Kofleriaceae bacterium]